MTATERADAALAISETKVVSVRAALEITSRIFESMGASSARSKYGFDRFCRSVRVHSLRDPLDHKVRDLGHWSVVRHPRLRCMADTTDRTT